MPHSNGGINPFSVINSFLNQLNPFNPNAGYASSDNDIRHNISANYIYALPFKSENRLTNLAVAGWQISGNVFFHTGFPFSIIDGAELGKFQADNLAGGPSSGNRPRHSRRGISRTATPVRTACSPDSVVSGPVPTPLYLRPTLRTAWLDGTRS